LTFETDRVIIPFVTERGYNSLVSNNLVLHHDAGKPTAKRLERQNSMATYHRPNGQIPTTNLSKKIHLAVSPTTATPLPAECACLETVGDNPRCPIAEHAELYRRREATNRTIRRIAELKIKQYGLNCTVDEYIAKCGAS
jgi:hypothetical protein